MSENEKEHVVHALSLMLDEYSEWFGRIMRKSFYPKESRDTSADPPANNSELLKDLEENGVHGRMAETLRIITSELHKAAEKLINSGSASDGRPEVKFMDDVINLYDEFVTHIRRLEKDKLLDGSGIHPLTGLRTEEAMYRDLQQEMERKARRGKPFCIVFSRIDGFREFLKTASEGAIGQMLHTVSDITRLCVRTYDDAYYPSDGDFVFCLKHADINGGLAAVNRLRRLLKENGEGITMSYVTAEPEEGEDVIKLLGYLREDLDRYVTEKDVSLQYYEVSPLKRYLEQGEQKDNE